jgi:DTW domain-containing protein YfiP
MSEPRVDDDAALGRDEVCEGCDVLARYCICADYDRLEDLE